MSDSRTEVQVKFKSLPSSWWNGSFSGFSSRDFSTPWVGGRKVGLTGRGLAIFSIFLEGQLESQAGRDEVVGPPPEKTHESSQTGKSNDTTPAVEGLRSSRTFGGCGSVVEARWQIAGGGGAAANGGGGGRGGGSGASAEPRHSSVHVRRRALLTSQPPEGGKQGSASVHERRKASVQSMALSRTVGKIGNHLWNEKYSTETQMLLRLSRGVRVGVGIDQIRLFS